MSNKYKKKSNTTPAQKQTISEAGYAVREQIKRMELHYAAREQQQAMQIGQLMVTAGAKVLQEQFGFTVEQSATWATEALKESRTMLADMAGKR